MYIISVLRLLTLCKYLEEVEMIVLISKVVRSPTRTFMVTLFTFYLVAYLYSEIGRLFFGGLITYPAVNTLNYDDSSMYDSYNFNDFMGAFSSISVLIATNNWNDFTDMYTGIIGTNYARIYFSFFFFVLALVLLNIVISFVLEIYSTLQEEVSEQFRKSEYIVFLSKHCKTEQQLLDLIASTFGEDILK